MRKPATHYAENMRRLRGRGWTLQRIGAKYGVTKQRVGQIIGTGDNDTYGDWRDRCSGTGGNYGE